MSDIEAVFRKHYSKMYRMAFILLHDEDESKDVVSGVFARLCEHPHTLRKGCEEAFLVTCVRNASLNLINSRKLHEKLAGLYPVDNNPDNELTATTEQRWKEIRNFIDTGLTPQTRLIFKLCFDEGRSYKEAADIAGVSVSAVNKHIVEALRKLRKKFASHGANA